MCMRALLFHSAVSSSSVKMRVLCSFLLYLGLCQQICTALVWYQPQQTHIAAGDTPDTMIIVWNTINDTRESRVRYGKGESIDMEAFGDSIKFVDSGPEKRAQYIHRVILTGLQPTTEYSYKVGSSLGWSDMFAFRTWPLGENWSPRLAVFGDMGKENAQSLPRLQMDAMYGMYDAILHVGDFAYDMEVDNARLGDEFMRQVEPLASRVPYMTCPGNHEEAYNFSNYRNRFWMPGDENKQMFFSFNMGPIHFVSVSTEFFFFPWYGLVPIFEQYKWLERDLAEANKPENRAKRPWIITYGHRPMYCSNDDDDDCTHYESVVRGGIPFLHALSWEKLFYKNGVDVSFWAHEHSYERSWPLYNNEVKNGSFGEPYTNPKGIVHITTGSAGCREDHDKFRDKPASWSAFRNNDYGYTRLYAINKTHLYMEQVSDDKGGAIVDKFTIIKTHHGPYPHDPRPVESPKEVVDKLVEYWNKH